MEYFVLSARLGIVLLIRIGVGIYRLRRTASVEPCRGRRRSDLAHRMVRGRTRRSRHLFWLPLAHAACIADILDLLRRQGAF